jgi:class 3 adenylate cyclase
VNDPFTPSPELAAIAKRWIESYAARRSEAVVNLFSSSAATTFIGSDEGELLTGAGFHQTFQAFSNDQVKLVTRDIEATGYQAGDFGWVWVTMWVDAPEAGKSVRFRNTFIFHLERDVWRIVHIHNSNPKPNIESMGYTSRSIEELAASARSGKLDLGQTGIASVMFTDIVDSTALAAAMGDAAWSQTIQRHLGKISGVITDHGGRMVKSLGDGTLSSFASARAALAAAQAIQQMMQSEQTEPRLILRIGIHTGDVVHADNDVLGGVVNKAARVAASAHPGDVRLSDATRAMIGQTSEFQFSAPLEASLKGLEGQHILYRLDWQT